MIAAPQFPGFPVTLARAGTDEELITADARLRRDRGVVRPAALARVAGRATTSREPPGRIRILDFGVEPSISVNKNVTIPDGNTLTTTPDGPPPEDQE